MAYATSIRERALRALRDLLGTMTQDQVPPSMLATEDPLRFSLDQDSIVFGPLTESQFKKVFAVGIMEGDHTLAHQMQVDTNFLLVTLELFFRLDAATGEEGMKQWNAILTDLHRLIRSDTTLGDLVSDVEILGDSVDPESHLDKKIDGAVFLRLNYKTANDDPRQRTPGVIP